MRWITDGCGVEKCHRREYPDITVILVAQRVSSVRNADQILVLDEGRVAGLGFHEELDGNLFPVSTDCENPDRR